MRAYQAVIFRCFLSTLTITSGSCLHGNSTGEVTEQPQEKWYSNLVLYNLDVDVFKDSDGDGTGDFKGLTQRLGYLDSLGVDGIWLAPFQPTPDQDDGYDVADFYGIDKRLGSKSDFDAFIKAAKEKGLKVMMDVVLNHTSTEHPWFKAARADTNSKYHHWYVWSAEKPKDWDKGMVFPGVQNETWTYDDATKKYYFHRFYDFQPDLNYERNDVRRMAVDVLSHWLKQGIDGFRLDAVPFIIDKPKTGAADPAHMFEILDTIAAAVKRVSPDVLLLGEANVTAEENKDFFGKNGSRLQMMFNFFANQHLFYSLAKNDPAVFNDALEEFRAKPGSSQWGFFLRNHDEIDLDRLSEKQRNLVYEKFGPESSMQLYDRGIRRRLAPMLADPALIRMSYSLLFSLPGAQVIRYGEEIGMGDDLTLRERLSVRTPMQWDTSRNAGFSKASKTFRPVIAYGDYKYQKVNVATALADKNSLLLFVKGLIKLRKEHPEIGLGEWKTFRKQKELFIIDYQYNGRRLITVHNFSKQQQKLTLDDEVLKGKLRPLFGNIRNGVLPGYGYQWYTIEI